LLRAAAHPGVLTTPREPLISVLTSSEEKELQDPGFLLAASVLLSVKLLIKFSSPCCNYYFQN
jgi:hypothetical protein